MQDQGMLHDKVRDLGIQNFKQRVKYSTATFVFPILVFRLYLVTIQSW